MHEQALITFYCNRLLSLYLLYIILVVYSLCITYNIYIYISKPLSLIYTCIYTCIYLYIGQEPSHSKVMSLLSQMWKIHKTKIGKGDAVRVEDIDIDALALDLVTNLSLEPV